MHLAALNRNLLTAALLCLAALPATALPAQEPEQEKKVLTAPLPRGKKLILKDGTYQLIREYERRDAATGKPSEDGNLVRYWSTERSAWEELPADLIDWEATRKAAEEEAARLTERAERIREAEIADRAAGIDVDASIEVAPGVFLPDGLGLFAWDGKLVTPLDQVQVEIKLNKGRLLTQILVPVPIIPSQHRVELPGKTAVTRLTSQPEFFIRLADDREPQLELIRAKVKGDKREIEVISTDIAGQQTSKRNTVSVQLWPVAKRVYRFTMSQTLEPGEYVLVEIIPDAGVSMFVWDFGVDSRPPALTKEGRTPRRDK